METSVNVQGIRSVAQSCYREICIECCHLKTKYFKIFILCEAFFSLVALFVSQEKVCWQDVCFCFCYKSVSVRLKKYRYAKCCVVEETADLQKVSHFYGFKIVCDFFLIDQRPFLTWLQTARQNWSHQSGPRHGE